jgi:hypothetical protein
MSGPYRPPQVWRAPDWDPERDSDVEDPGESPGRDTGAAHGVAVARLVGPLSPFSACSAPLRMRTPPEPSAAPASCAPGRSDGCWLLDVMRARPEASGEAEPRGWDAGAGARAEDAAWWRAAGERLSFGWEAPPLDVDEAIGARGVWEYEGGDGRGVVGLEMKL